MIRLWTIVHELCSISRVVGLRNRLRCPECGAVGTYKPHGGIVDRLAGDKRAVRRWMCKHCDLYYGPEGRLRVFPNVEMKYWDVPANATATNVGETPQALLKRAKLNPWSG
jgi:hypothetical protein